MSVQLDRCFVALEALECGGDFAENDAKIFLRCLTMPELAAVGELCTTLARICREKQDRRTANETDATMES